MKKSLAVRTAQRASKNAPKRRILVLFHGGTIGMVQNAQGEYEPPEDDAGFSRAISGIVDIWKEKKAPNYETDYVFVTAKDSIHITESDWTALILRIQEAQSDKYDGVLVAHGTDTMVDTIAATAYGLLGGTNGLRIPVVFTGSQNPLGIFGGDANRNLEHSLMVLQECIDGSKPIADILLVFDALVMKGTRAMKRHETEYRAFESAAEVGKVGWVHSGGVYLDHSRSRLMAQASGKLEVTPHFGQGVKVEVVSATTSPTPLLLNVHSGVVRALMLLSPGAGNVPVEGPHSFLQLITEATQKAIVPVLIGTQYAGGSAGCSPYPTGSLILKAGAAAAYDMTPNAGKVKLAYALGRGITRPEQVREFMDHSIAGEVSKPPYRWKK